MNKLPLEKRVEILNLLVEGNSLRAAARITDTAFNTVAKLFVDAGRACAAYQDQALRDLPCQRVQFDEVCSFVCSKQKNVARAKAAPEDAGDVWTWVAIDADTKLVPSWRVGDRSGQTGAFTGRCGAAGVTERLWSIEDIANVVEAAAPKPGRRATYKKRVAEISN